MPNWCNNNITISGPTETIKQLWEDAQTGHRYTVEVDGEQVEKVEFGLLEAMAPIGNWEYGTAVDTWGTKWDISDEGLEYEDTEDGYATISGWFDSAWSPPIEAYNTWLTENGECSIRATYEEGGMDFAGIYEDMEDDYMDGVNEWSLAVLKGTCALEDTPEIFQKLDSEMDLVEAREYLLDREEEVSDYNE